MNTLRLILGDQLNYHHSWYQHKSNSVFYVLMEMKQETDYVKHHAQKVLGFFASMYNFSKFLEKKGHQVIYIDINHPKNTQNLTQNLQFLIQDYQIHHFEYQWPDEYRLDEQLKSFSRSISISYKSYDTEHFYTTRYELQDFFAHKKQYVMESFYRYMRKKHSILMDKNAPRGGVWNFDKENRMPYKNAHAIPESPKLNHNYSDIWNEIKKAGVQTFGNPKEKNFPWPTTRKQSLEVLYYFCQHLLTYFGTYQDAMHIQYTSLYHSKLSFSLNTKMISPKEVIQAVLNYWEQESDKIHIAQVEGFLRQILGWREYMRGIYWANMPTYKELNYFNHANALPDWYWTGNTKMNCLKHAISQSLEDAYAHHIQRLMITGNFALLTMVHPDEVDAWYLGIYIDAIEWVEITNTRGMSQYADGGIVGTKPYISSATYIHKMSNYCKTCYYSKDHKIGENACPFNALYWNFYDTHRLKLQNNPRVSMMYKIWDKFSEEEKKKIREKANKYLSNINLL